MKLNLFYGLKLCGNLILLSTFAFSYAQKQSIDNNTGLWITNATWTDNSSPGFTNVPSFIIFGDVTSESSITMVNAASQSVDIRDTLVIEGGLTFAANKNFASVTVRSGGILVIFGTLAMGKNNAGVTVEAGGVLVVTGDVVDNGGGGNTINATGDVYIGGSSSDIGGSGTVKPIDALSDDGFTEVEDFVGGGGETPLPVELLYFEAKNQSNIFLNWATVSEINNEYFSIERSEDGINFYEIGRVLGSGTTNEIIEYSFVDKFPFASIEFYRLKQVDFDGKFEHFEVTRIETSIKQQNDDLNVFPSIVTEEKVNIKSNHPFQLQSLMIYDLAGGKYIDLIGDSLQENPLTYSVKIQSLSPGVYLLRMTTSVGKEATSRIIIK